MGNETGVAAVTVRRVDASAVDAVNDDLLAVEEPLEIRIGLRRNGRIEHKPISITMRTPGADIDLAAGFLFTEGIIHRPNQIKNIRHCGQGSEPGAGRVPAGASPSGVQVATGSTNTIRVDLHDGIDIDLKRLERNFYTTSSCGVCGKTSIEALHTGARSITDSYTPRVSPALIHSLPASLRASQEVFESTGGLHASALFNTAGKLETVREDVGRHNALDKVIGARFMAGETPLSETILLVSGRASFELVQKALMAGIPVLAAVGAPSSLAVELAAEFGMTLIGFVRDNRFNVYAGKARIV